MCSGRANRSRKPKHMIALLCGDTCLMFVETYRFSDFRPDGILLGRVRVKRRAIIGYRPPYLLSPLSALIPDVPRRW